MDNIKETDLYRPMYNFLVQQGYEVRSENNFCDITALKQEELLIIELKRSLNLEVLLQAVKRQRMTDIVYIAVPRSTRVMRTQKWKDICHLIRRLELGLVMIKIDEVSPSVEIAIQPQTFDRIKSKRMNNRRKELLLQEFKHRSIDMNVGGSTRTKLVTAYREKSLYIACCLDIFGPLSPKNLKRLGTDIKKTNAILSKDFYGWFSRIDKGVYTLSDSGRECIGKYQVLTDSFKEKIRFIQDFTINDTKTHHII